MADLTITITINETDQKILKNDLLDLDDLFQAAVTGKINNSWKRMHSEWTQRFTNDESFTDPIPSNKVDFVNLVVSQDDYKTRAERDAESPV